MSLVFESERLVFRPLVDGDLDLLIEQWTDSDVARFVGGRIYTEQELARDMPKVTRRCAGGCIGNWCLVEKSTGGKIGTINLLPMPVDLADTDWELVDGDALPEGDIELGYILKKSAWGNGYGQLYRSSAQVVSGYNRLVPALSHVFHVEQFVLMVIPAT